MILQEGGQGKVRIITEIDAVGAAIMGGEEGEKGVVVGVANDEEIAVRLGFENEFQEALIIAIVLAVMIEVGCSGIVACKIMILLAIGELLAIFVGLKGRQVVEVDLEGFPRDGIEGKAGQGTPVGDVGEGQLLRDLAGRRDGGVFSLKQVVNIQIGSVGAEVIEMVIGAVEVAEIIGEAGHVEGAEVQAVGFVLAEGFIILTGFGCGEVGDEGMKRQVLEALDGVDIEVELRMGGEELPVIGKPKVDHHAGPLIQLIRAVKQGLLVGGDEDVGAGVGREVGVGEREVGRFYGQAIERFGCFDGVGS